MFSRDLGAFGRQAHDEPPTEGTVTLLAIVSAILFFIAFLINAAEISTNDVFSSTNVMLLGLTALALHLAGIGTGWSARGGRRS